MSKRSNKGVRIKTIKDETYINDDLLCQFDTLYKIKEDCNDAENNEIVIDISELYKVKAEEIDKIINFLENTDCESKDLSDEDEKLLDDMPTQELVELLNCADFLSSDIFLEKGTTFVKNKIIGKSKEEIKEYFGV